MSYRLSSSCLAVTIGTLIVGALLGPRWGTSVEDVPTQAADVWFCVDVSRSMLARDAPVNRLESAKAMLAAALPALDSRPVGLVAFGGEAEIVCPPTLDHEHIAEESRKLTVDSAPPGGSNVTGALSLIAREVNAAETAMVLLLSDGGHEPIALTRAEIESLGSICLTAIGVGASDRRSPIPLPPADQPLREAGREVETSLNMQSLNDLATQLDGVYLSAGTTRLDSGQVVRTRLLPHCSNFARLRTAIPRERYQWLLLPAVVLALGSLVSRRPRSVELAACRQVRCRRHLVASALLLAIASGGLAQPDDTKAEATTTDADRYHAAAAAYRSGRWNDAVGVLDQLTTSADYRSLAHFGMGNAHVQMALDQDRSAGQSQALLRAAIADYRLALESSRSEYLPEEDIRYNLELAKRLLHSDGQAGAGRAQPEKGAETKEQTQESITATQPEAKPATKASGDSTTREDKGQVLTPLPGLGFTEVGPLASAEARGRLERALERIRQSRPRRLTTPGRPRMAGDY